jgi:hypothetical protein
MQMMCLQVTLHMKWLICTACVGSLQYSSNRMTYYKAEEGVCFPLCMR